MPLFEGTQQQYYNNSQSFTATANQQVFTLTFNPLPTSEVEFDVFVNGIKLTDSEFTATNGTAVVLSVGCFVGDIVELVSYNTVSHAGGGGGGGNLNNVVEDTSPQLGGNLDLFHKTITGTCLLYTSPSPRDLSTSRMTSSA